MRSKGYNRVGQQSIQDSSFGIRTSGFVVRSFRTKSYEPRTMNFSRTKLPNANIDYPLLFIVVTLVLIGLVVVYASTYHLGFRYFKWQFLRALTGFLALWLGTKINLLRIEQKTFTWMILCITIILMAATLLFGKVLGVARRQILLFQPQEFAKFGIIIYLAGYFYHLKESNFKPGFIKSTLIPGAAVGIVVLLTLLQPAVGTSVLISISSFAVFIIAGVNWRHLLITFIVGVLSVGAGLVAMPLLRNTKYHYIPERWENFWSGDRYHQTQALIALGSGGPLGRGLGEGRQKYYFIPKLHKDFIFCALGEDFGFAGCLLVMVLYVLFYLRTLRVAEKTTSEFGQILSAGMGTMIILYALLHIAVSLSIIPTTGQPLPFISYGGSALTANLLAAGLILKISRYQRSSIEQADFNRRGWNRWSYLSRARAR